MRAGKVSVCCCDHSGGSSHRARASSNSRLANEMVSRCASVAIGKVLKEQLAIYQTLKKAGKVVPFVFHRDGERIKYFRAAWANACEEAGCPNALVHDMRRSAVRTFERAGVPRSAAMSMVGHKTESIYRRYAIVDEAMQREAAARLDAWAPKPQPRSMSTVAQLRKAGR